MFYKNLILQLDDIFQLKYVLPTQSTMLFSRRKKPHKNSNKNRKQQKQRMMFFLPLQEMTLFIDTCITVYGPVSVTSWANIFKLHNVDPGLESSSPADP